MKYLSVKRLCSKEECPKAWFINIGSFKRKNKYINYMIPNNLLHIWYGFRFERTNYRKTNYELLAYTEWTLYLGFFMIRKWVTNEGVIKNRQE